MEARGIDQGICLHHRDGQDWYNHCSRWSSINDGIYRGNCLGVPGRTFVESLEDRGLKAGKWVYYCGDHDIPRDLSDPKSSYEVVSRKDLMGPADVEAVLSIKRGATSLRDLWALIDFYICSSLPHFIGNSVSTFSAIQIALRKMENTFWYATVRRFFYWFVRLRCLHLTSASPFAQGTTPRVSHLEISGVCMRCHLSIRTQS
jgi:hypothetical protein